MAKSEGKKQGKTLARPIMKKISARELCGDIKKIADGYDEGSVVDLFRVAGVIHRVRHITTKYGDSCGFKGQFVAQNLMTKDESDKSGLVVEGREFFAPGDFQDELATSFASRPEGVDVVEFAAKVSIQVVDDEKSAKGYIYIVEPLIDAGPSDALAAIVAKGFGTDMAKLTNK